MDRGGVRRDGEGSDQAHLLQGGVTARCLVQELMVFQVLGETLQHRQRLIEVHLSQRSKSHETKTDSQKMLANLSARKKDAPHTLTGMGILESSLPMQFFMMLHRLRE